MLFIATCKMAHNLQNAATYYFNWNCFFFVFLALEDPLVEIPLDFLFTFSHFAAHRALWSIISKVLCTIHEVNNEFSNFHSTASDGELLTPASIRFLSIFLLFEAVNSDSFFTLLPFLITNNGFFIAPYASFPIRLKLTTEPPIESLFFFTYALSFVHVSLSFESR